MAEERVPIPIRYVERCMDTCFRLSPETSLDEKTQDDISRAAKKKYFNFLGFKEEDFQEDPFSYSGSGLYDSDGEPRKASCYQGEFQVCLKAENREKGFPYIVHELKTQLKNCEGDKTTLQTQLDEAQWTGEEAGETSGEKKGKKKKKKKGNKRDDGEGNSLQAKTEAVSVGNDDLKSRMEAILAESQIVIDLKTEVGKLKTTVGELKTENKLLKSKMDAVLNAFQLATKVHLCIALDKARKKLTVDLGRGPGDRTWEEFILTMSPAEMAKQLEMVSRRALDLMSTGKKDLNRIVHEGALDLMSTGTKDLNRTVHEGAKLEEIGAVVTSTQDKRQAWFDVFKYAYDVDPAELDFVDAPC